MQNNTQNQSDARTFAEIWGGLTPAQRSELRFQLTRNGECSRVSVYKWAEKGVYPISLGMRRRVSNIVNKTLGIKTTHMTLFP